MAKQALPVVVLMTNSHFVRKRHLTSEISNVLTSFPSDAENRRCSELLVSEVILFPGLELTHLTTESIEVYSPYKQIQRQ